MAITLKKSPKPLVDPTLTLPPSRKIEPETIKVESELCALFMREFNAIDGWECYPEAADFDILVVHRDGRQIGVEAKLTLNAKVVDQILPEHYHDTYEQPGPDHRLVIVSKVSDASKGIAKMLQRLGVKVLCPRLNWGREGHFWTYELESSLLDQEKEKPMIERERMFDWNPAQRCRVPAIRQDLPAGVKSPVKLTPWKESALKVVALMRHQGFITAKQIASYGVSVPTWTQGPGTTQAWLAKGRAQGQWIETEYMPAFDKQHPELYARVEAAIAAEMSKEFALV